MLSRHHRLGLHAAAAVVLAGVAVVATGGAGNAAAASRPDSYGGDATSAPFEYQVDKSPSPFPVVTDPFHIWVPYAETSLDSSGAATGIASSVYPGQDILGVPALICEFAAQLCNNIPGGIPNYPDWAFAQYPTHKDDSATLSQKPFPGTGPFEVTPNSVTAHADPDRVEATTIVSSAGLDPVATARSATSHSKQSFEGSTLVVDAESTVKGIDIGGGAVHIDQITSTATARVDGGKISAASAITTFSGATAGGTPITIDSTGIHAAGQGDGGAANKQVNAVLANLEKAGITIRSLGITKQARTGQVQAETGGLLITFKRTVTLPTQLPPQVPVSPEGDYFGTLALGRAGVSAFATPAVPLGNVTLPVAPPAVNAGGPPPAAAGALPGSLGTAATVPNGAQPAVVGPAGKRPVALLGVDLTNKRLRTLMLVLLGYPLLVLLTAPLRAPARLPRLR
jgi:hypothetical protein